MTMETIPNQFTKNLYPDVQGLRVSEDIYISVVAKQSRSSTSTRVLSMSQTAIGKMICRYCSSKATNEESVRLGTMSLCYFIQPIQRDTAKLMPPVCELDYA